MQEKENDIWNYKHEESKEEKRKWAEITQSARLSKVQYTVPV